MFLPSVKILVKFDNISLYESISHGFLTAVGGNDIDILSNNLGYVMQYGQYLEGQDLTVGVTTDMMVGFWLYPFNLGMVRNPDTDEVESTQMTLLDFAKTNETVTILSMYESTLSNGDNYLTININNGEYIASSEPYSTEMWHYFWIVYTGNPDPSLEDTRQVSIYVDGSPHTLQDISGFIPDRLDENKIDLYVNKELDGVYAYNKTSNTGYIDDLVVFNESDRSESILQRAINYSIDYVVNDNYEFSFDKYYGVMFDDQPVVSVNSLVDDMAYIYLGRDDGKILRGSPLLWETRKNFSDPREESLMDETIIGGGVNDAAIVKNGLLRIDKSFFKL